MKTHKRFMEEITEASSLPSQTKKTFGPETEEDFAMYEGDKQ